LKRFDKRFAVSSDGLFFFTMGDLERMKEGSSTYCLAALDVKYSRIRAEGLYCLTANFTSDVEMSV
jgi:hypothetical protein